MSITVDNFREKAPEFLFLRLSNGRNALLDAPPGLGKTKGGAKVAIRINKEMGKRVLIIEPTKTLRSQVEKYLQEEGDGIEFHVSKGWNDYICPLTNTKADLCSTRKETCREENIKCGVLDDIDKTINSNITLATFSKLLLSKNNFKGYDTIIVDESHGFETAESSYLQTYVMFKQIENVINEINKENPALAEKLTNLHTGLSRMNDRLGDSDPLTSQEVDIIKREFGDTSFRDAWISYTRENKFPRYNSLYKNIANLHYLMQSVGKNVFFFYEGSLYGRPKNMEVEISGFFRDKNVGLLSATIDDAVKHARACGLDMRRFSDEDWCILKQYPKVRRENRKLFALTDGPNLGRRSDDQYNDSRLEANEILAQLLDRYKMRTLVLFRGYNDQQMAWKYLEPLNFSKRIYNIWQGDDTEIIDEKINQLRESDIVLSSAASRLWEGVDIPGLRLLIIDALPFPSKDPLDKEYNFRTSYISMIKKLKQGLGRIVRSDDDWGAAIIIDKRFDERFNSIAPKLPWFMGDDFKRRTLSETFQDIDYFINNKK